MTLDLILMTGADIPVPEIKSVIHQPTIKDISMIGETEFFTGLHLITISTNFLLMQQAVIPQIENTTNFQIFISLINQKDFKDKKEEVIKVFSLLFPNKNIIITPQSIILSEQDKDVIILDETNFELIQGYVKKIFCLDKSSGNQNSGFNPADKKAAEIAKKLMRGRERVAEQKGEAQSSLLGRITSSLAIGLQIPITIINNYTLYQIYDQMERFSMHTSWDLNIRTRLAGGKPDDQPTDWMKNIH